METNMKLRTGLILALFMGLMASVNSNAYAVACDIEDTVVASCDGDCNVISFVNDVAGCETGATVKINRRVTGTLKWLTIATNPSSPFTDCPAAGYYDYQIVLDCPECEDNDSVIVTNLCCSQ